MFLADLDFEYLYADGTLLDENSEPLLCRLEDGVVYNNGLRMVMLNGDPLLRRVTEIVDRVFEAGLYNFWVSLDMHKNKIDSGKISIVYPLGGYYSFNFYHMQPAFYLLLMGWCLSSLCFMFELLFNRQLCRRKWSWYLLDQHVIQAVLTQDFVTHNFPVSSLVSFYRVN